MEPLSKKQRKACHAFYQKWRKQEAAKEKTAGDAMGRAAWKSGRDALLNEYPMWQNYRDSTRAEVGAVGH